MTSRALVICLAAWCSVLALLALQVSQAKASEARHVWYPEEIAPVIAPFDMPPLERPVFRDADFDIRDHGARQEGEAGINTAAIASAIEACTASGGGTVIVPAGTWHTGPIHLKSHVNLYLSAGSLLVFSDNPEDYLPVVFTRWAGFELHNYSPLIYAADCENIAITGPGALDGNGAAWWPWFGRQAGTIEKAYEEGLLVSAPLEARVFGTPEAGLRPQFINFMNCKNILLEGFRIVAPGPFWTIHLVYCDGIIARGLQVFTYSDNAHNCDGFNFDSSRNGLIEHCFFDTKDDCVCMKAGINEDGLRVNKPTENIVVRHITTRRGHGGIVFGSDTSGWIRNIHVHDCVYDGTLKGIRFKSTRGRGGGAEMISIENIIMKDIMTEAIVIETTYNAWFGTESGPIPVFRDISMKNISCNGARDAVVLEGISGMPLSNIALDKVTIKADKGMRAGNVHGLRLRDVQIDPETGHRMHFENVEDIIFE